MDKRGGRGGHDGDDGSERDRDDGRQQQHQGAKGDEGAGGRTRRKNTDDSGYQLETAISGRHNSAMSAIETKAN